MPYRGELQINAVRRSLLVEDNDILLHQAKRSN